MIISKAVYKEKMVKRNVCVKDEVNGCDQCKEVIKEYPNEPSRLILTVFRHDDSNSDFHFCSWDCVLKFIPKIKIDYFFNLPSAMFDGDQYSDEKKKLIHKRSGKRLFQLLKKIK